MVLAGRRWGRSGKTAWAGLISLVRLNGWWVPAKEPRSDPGGMEVEPLAQRTITAVAGDQGEIPAACGGKQHQRSLHSARHACCNYRLLYGRLRHRLNISLWQGWGNACRSAYARDSPR